MDPMELQSQFAKVWLHLCFVAGVPYVTIFKYEELFDALLI